MSKDDGAEKSTLGAGPTIIVKGGTTSARYDEERDRRRHAGELGRAHQDKQMQAARVGETMTPDGFVSAHLTSLRLMDRGAPMLVLHYMNRDRTIRQSCVAELVMLPDGDEVFVMVCPRCLERGEPADNCQVMVKKSHRSWELDTTKAGTIVFLENPDGRPFQVKICGTVSSDHTLRCSNFNCNWAVRVERSEVWEV
jgi:hypothetical protein